MPPSIAALLTVLFIFVLFRRDARKQGEVSGALWLPVLWMAITGSRFVSQWINLGNSGFSVDVQEGSPIDAIYLLTLITMGMGVLARRRTFIGEILRNNRWLAAFFIYGFLSIAWSDFPFIAFKRYIKVLGHPVMALIILTDPDPTNALRTVMKRCAYLMMPLSVLFIKYYPEYGKMYNSWTGEASITGVGLQKNNLGYLCMVFGIFFFWNLLITRRIEDRRVRREEFLLSVGFLCMIGWLWHMAQSATSLVTLGIGIVTMILLGLRIVNKQFIGTYFIVIITVVVLAQLSFDIYAKALNLLGRDPTLTDRTEIWADAVALCPNPVIGTGFESFWLGPRLQKLWAMKKYWWQPNQSHNGYVETYLNLGSLGVLLLVGLLISTFRKINADLLRNFDFARLRLGFLFAITFYNYTEAAFLAVHFVWTVFHIIAIDYPRPVQSQKNGAKHSSPQPDRKKTGQRPERRSGANQEDHKTSKPKNGDENKETK
jgi:exopolysaccharide production protein ExoQ